MLFVNSYFGGKMINYPFAKQIKDISPSLLLGTCVMVTTYLLSVSLVKLYNLNDISMILISLSSFFTLYFLISHIFKMKSIVEIRTILSQGVSKIKKKR